jgi:hypothetical protein
MKKFLFLLITLIVIPFNISALTIDNLGLSIDLPDGYKVSTRNNKEESYDFYSNNVYLKMEDYLGSDMYIRVVENPGIADYTAKKDLIDEVHGLIKVVNTNEYEYIDTKDYRFIKFEYQTKEKDKELVEYYLAWKDLFITITFQSKDSTLTKAMKETTDDIVKSIILTGNGKVEGIHVDVKKIDYLDLKKVNITLYVVEIVVCALIIFGVYKYTRRSK